MNISFDKQKAVILAGGLGTRISEESVSKPKPMIEIGGKPIIWHIMKSYSHYGINNFIVCCGYKGYMIKEYFLNYTRHNSDVVIDMESNSYKILSTDTEPWNITLADTGDHTQTGGRLKKISKYLSDDPYFFMTYGDGLSDIDIVDELNFHLSHGKLATILSVRPPGRFGALDISDDNLVKQFIEKPSGDGGRINGGFFILSPAVLDLIDSNDTLWEKEPLERLAESGELVAFDHDGFWQPMDTLRDKNYLEELWESGNPPWKI